MQFYDINLRSVSFKKEQKIQKQSPRKITIEGRNAEPLDLPVRDDLEELSDGAGQESGDKGSIEEIHWW